MTITTADLGSASLQRPTSSQRVTTGLTLPGGGDSVRESFSMTREMMESAAGLFEQYSRSAGRSVSFQVVGGSAKFLIKVTNPESGELVRQIPSDEVLRLMKFFETRGSVMVDQSA